MLVVISLATVLLAVGCHSSRRLTKDSAPIEYTPMACFAFDGNRNTPTPFHLPIEAHQKLALEGDAYCQLSLGNRYEKGLDAPVDYEQARKWYSMPPYRDLQLGRMAEEGVGQPVDLQQAKDHYRKAAELGFRGGHLALGNLLERESNSETERQEVMAHYFKATKSYGDGGWVEMQRMLSKGATLNDEQKIRYIQLWVNGFRNGISRRIRRNARSKEVFAKVSKDSPNLLVDCTYFSSGAAPEFKVVESSGVPEVDAFMIGLLKEIEMDPVQVPGTSDRFEFSIPFDLRGAQRSQFTESKPVPSTPTR